MAETVEATEAPSRARRFGQAVVDRLPQLSVAIVGGLALCLSFPPFGWWFLAFFAFVALAWVLTRETTTLAGGFGYGFLFGLVFYLPLLPWISGLVGPFPWIALSIMEALFPALFGLLAVAVRRLPGWPLWFAGLWAAQEWLKSTVPFGGFPWGVVGFSQTDSPMLPIAQLGGAPLLSFAVVLIGFSLAAIAFETVQWWQRGKSKQNNSPPAVVLAGVCISVVLLGTALAWPQRSAVRRRRRRRSGHHGGRRTGQRATAGAGVQRTAPGRARQSRPRDGRPCGGRARRQGAAADDRHLAGELLGYRSAGQPGRQSGDLHRRGGHRRTHPGRGRRRGAWIPPRQPRVDEHGDRLESRDRSRGSPRQEDRPALRGVPAVARLLRQAVAVRRKGRLLRARRRATGWCRRQACRSASPPAGK